MIIEDDIIRHHSLRVLQVGTVVHANVFANGFSKNDSRISFKRNLNKMFIISSVAWSTFVYNLGHLLYFVNLSSILLQCCGFGLFGSPGAISRSLVQKQTASNDIMSAKYLFLIRRRVEVQLDVHIVVARVVCCYFKEADLDKHDDKVTR